MPKIVEQVLSNGKVVHDPDTSYRGLKIFENLLEILDSKKAKVEKYNQKHVLTYTRDDRKKVGLLVKYVTYLGHPWQLSKKRIQLPKWYKDISINKPKDLDDIKFIGVYEYDDRCIIIDFVKDTYIKQKMNNSSAHVNTIDLVQTTKHGEFNKIDNKGNKILLFNEDRFQHYLETNEITNPNINELLSDFTEYIPKTPVYLIDAMKQMYAAGNTNWRQTRWSGWYLEYLFKKYIDENNLSDNIEVGFNPGPLKLNLDIWFSEEEHYGDLKAHGDDSSKLMGNDIEVVGIAIKEYSKLWYLVAENKAIKDDKKLTANHQRVNLIKEYTGEIKSLPRAKVKAYYQYHSLVLIEINDANLKYLDEFQKGWINSDGNYRKGKISIKNKYLKDDNMVIFRKKI